MPFTISHAVLAPPIAKLSGYSLPIAGLAIGCMAPDLHRLFTSEHFNLPHQWQGILSFTLWLGLAFSAVWYGLYRPVLYRFLGISDQIILSNFKDALKFILGLCLAIIIGIATHLIWDGLTHVDFRTFAFHDFLGQSIQIMNQSYPMHRLLQVGSSAITLPIVIWMLWHYIQVHRTAYSVSKIVICYAIGLFSLAIALGLFAVWDYARYIPSEFWHEHLYQFTGRSINEFSQAGMVCFSLGAILFLFLDRNRALSNTDV